LTAHWAIPAPEPIEQLGKYVNKCMALVETPQNPDRAIGDPDSLAVVLKVVTTLLGEVGEVPLHGDVGLPGDENIGPSLKVPHVGLDEQAAPENGLEIAEAYLTVSEGADADPAPLQLGLEEAISGSR
jgi:hypothetical protein